MKKKVVLAVVIMCVLQVEVSLGAIKKYFPIDHDTYINYANMGGNYGSAPTILLSNSPPQTSALLKATSLNPSLAELHCFNGSKVYRATLWLYQNSTAVFGVGMMDIGVSQLTGSWDESTVTASSATTLTWPAPFQVLRAQSNSELPLEAGWYGINITNAVKNWFNGATNDGLGLGYGYYANQYANYFSSSETSETDEISPLGTKAPYIEVEFHSQYEIPINQDTYIDVAAVNTNTGTETTMYTWYSAYNNNLNILLQATNLISSLKSQMGISDTNMIDLAGAEIRLYHKDFYRTFAGDIYTINQPWSESTVTYANQPDATLDYDMKYYADDKINWVAIDVTEIVHDWLKGIKPNYGLEIIPHPNSNYNHQYYTHEYSDPSFRPFFVITINESPRCFGAEGTIYLSADSNKDGAVDMKDIGTLCAQWLVNTAP